MKTVFLVIIVLISIASFYNIVPSADLVKIYGILAVAPIAFILLRKHLLYGLFLWFIFSLFKRSWRVFIPMLPDLPPERIMWAALFAIILIDVALKKRKLVVGSMKIEAAMILFCVYVLLSGLVIGTVFVKGEGLQIKPFLTAYFIPFSIYFLVKNIIDEDQKIRKVFLFFTVIGLYLGVTAIFEHFKLYYLVFPEYIANPAVGIHWGQARGPFVQAGVNGLVMGMIFFMTLYLLLYENKKWIKHFLVISIICILTGLLFTFNRGSWIGFAFAALWAMAFLPQVRRVFFIGLSGLIMVYFATYIFDQMKTVHKEERETVLLEEKLIAELDTGDAIKQRFVSKGSIYSRLNVQKAALKMIAEKPLFGFGYFTFKKVSPKYYENIKDIPFTIGGGGVALHNHFLLILVELGLVGLVLYLLIFFYILNMCRNLYFKQLNKEFTGKNLVLTVGAVSIVFFIGMFVREIHYIVFPNALLFSMFGILSGLEQRLQSKHLKKQEIFS